MKHNSKKKRFTKKERDINAAVILLSAFIIAFYYFLYNDDMHGINTTVIVFTVVLCMDAKIERLERRYKKLREAYDEQIIRPAVKDEVRLADEAMAHEDLSPRCELSSGRNDMVHNRARHNYAA